MVIEFFQSAGMSLFSGEMKPRARENEHVHESVVPRFGASAERLPRTIRKNPDGHRFFAEYLAAEYGVAHLAGGDPSMNGRCPPTIIFVDSR